VVFSLVFDLVKIVEKVKRPLIDNGLQAKIFHYTVKRGVEQHFSAANQWFCEGRAAPHHLFICRFHSFKIQG
jgi:hypothetical protein